jgi:hypothetical protein
MGNKQGYGETILAALGLRSGQGAGAYLWAEADDDVAALLRCYPDASMLRRVAEIIRGWADEEPRALWDRLRAERKARGVRVDAEGTAEWLTSGWLSYGQDPGRGFRATAGGGWPDDSPDPQTIGARCHRLAEYATIVSGNRLVNMAGPALMNTGNGGTRHGGEFATPVGDVAERFEGMAREVAAVTIEHRWSFSEKGPTFGYGGPGCDGGQWGQEKRDRALGCDNTAGRMDRLSQGWPPVLVLPAIPEAADVAAWMGTPGDLEDCVVYMDPPYAGTTGYAATLSRDQVVRHARAYAEIGAVVAISEAEVVIAEWDAVEITGGRRGQKRTFSKQQAEWLTMNREPAHRVAVQAGLFAVGA